MKKLRIHLTIIAFGLTVGWLSACTNWERSAFQSLSASKAAIDAAQAAYEVSAPTGACPVPSAVACIPHSQGAYLTINEAKSAQKTAVDALVTYETAKAASAGQASLDAAQTNVEVALEALPKIIADVKALYAGGK